MIDHKELRKIVRFCQKNGIIKFKSGNFEIEISGKPSLPRKVQVESQQGELKESKVETFPSWDSLSPEEKLLWSATPNGINFGGT